MEHIAHHLEEKERTRDIEIDENVTFTDLLLSEPVLAGLHAAGFRRPSPIQLAAIPLGRCGLDLVVQAKSGTGKTCVLAVVALEAVSAASSATQAVVVAPTREVAVQVAQVVSRLASAIPDLSTAAFIGGTKLAEDKDRLRRCQVVVGTPGRLAQLVSLGHLKLQCVRLLVLDEADRLLEGNFLGPVTDLAKALPLNKQVLCLSATYSDSAAAQAEALMRSPSHVRLDRESPTLLGVNQIVRRLPPVATSHMRQAAKEAELLELLSHITFNQCLVFSGSQMRAESVCHRLKAKGWPATHLTAAQCQTERLAALEALCSHRCRILVATDLAARGLDSAHVNLVVSLDLPPDPPTYLHRAGRAGRYGSRGTAVMLVCGPDEWYGVRAIATLANVKLLLAGKKWDSNLATKKVEGWRPGAWKEKEEEVSVGEPETDQEARVKKENKEEEEEGVEKSQEERRQVEERSEEGEDKKEKVMRLMEVEHLDEEEARAWMKAHKPYRKEAGQTAASQGKEAQQNGVLQAENKKKPTKGDSENSRNGVGNEVKTETNSPTNSDKKECKKLKKKKQSHKNNGGHREEKEEEEEDKENRGENCDKNRKHTHMNSEGENHTNTTKQEQESNTNTQEIETERNTDTKTHVMSLVNRLWHRPPPVTMSYSNLLSECTAQHGMSSSSPDTPVKVPPWPVQAKANEDEMAALERYLNGMREEVAERKQVQDGVTYDTLAILSAVTQGKDTKEMLEGKTQQIQQDSFAVSLHTSSNSSTPHSKDSNHSSSGNLEHATHTLRKDCKRTSPTTNKPKHKASPVSKDAVPSSSDSELSCSRQKHVLSSIDNTQPSDPTEHAKHHPSMPTQAHPQKKPPHSSTGTRPKEKKQGRKQKHKHRIKESATYDDQDEEYGNYPYNQWRQVSDQDNQDDTQGYQNYNQTYVTYDQGQNYDQTYQNYHQGYQDYNEGYQDYNQSYQDYNQTYQDNNQSYQDYNQGYQGYNQGYLGQSYPQYAAPASYVHTPYGYTYGPQADAYMKSACKFASMMEYVSTMGRVSLHVAQDYHNRRKQRHKQQ